jgi:hypothetical protein
MFLHNLLNALVQSANKVGLQQKLHSVRTPSYQASCSVGTDTKLPSFLFSGYWHQATKLPVQWILTPSYQASCSVGTDTKLLSFLFSGYWHQATKLPVQWVPTPSYQASCSVGTDTKLPSFLFSGYWHQATKLPVQWVLTPSYQASCSVDTGDLPCEYIARYTRLRVPSCTSNSSHIHGVLS